MKLADICGEELLNQINFNNNSNRTFVLVVNLNACNRHLSRFWQCLSFDEKLQATQYHTKSLSNKYIIAHGFLRCILSHLVYKTPESLEFVANYYGKPHLKNESINFNMSHSHDIVSFIVSLQHEVGIDIEFHDNTQNIEEFAHLIFSEEEYKFFNTMEKNTKQTFFYNVWTKKESLIKTIGMGLSYPINTIETLTLLPGKKIELTNHPNKSTPELSYFPLHVALNYSGAIAISHKTSEIVYLKYDMNR